MKLIERPVRRDEYGHPRHDPYLAGMEGWLADVGQRVYSLRCKIQALRFPPQPMGVEPKKSVSISDLLDDLS